jgi:hypothetical protein
VLEMFCLQVGVILFASGCVLFASGCVLFASGCVLFASGCVLFASGCEFCLQVGVIFNTLCLVCFNPCPWAHFDTSTPLYCYRTSKNSEHNPTDNLMKTFSENRCM